MLVMVENKKNVRKKNNNANSPHIVPRAGTSLHPYMFIYQYFDYFRVPY